jgi:hypothetical protein
MNYSSKIIIHLNIYFAIVSHIAEYLSITTFTIRKILKFFIPTPLIDNNKKEPTDGFSKVYKIFQHLPRRWLPLRHLLQGGKRHIDLSHRKRMRGQLRFLFGFPS